MSGYRYGGTLTDHPSVAARPFESPPALAGLPRAAWWVLDEDAADPAALRGDRDPAFGSRFRPHTEDVLNRLFRDPALRAADGMFLTPYTAAAVCAGRRLGRLGATGWSVSTVHAVQGAEADVVLLDTVHVGDTGFSADDWRRLTNVALSRARHQVLLLATRGELASAPLRPLADLLEPVALRRAVAAKPGGGVTRARWEPAAGLAAGAAPRRDGPAPPAESLGGQIARRKQLSAALSAEQRRLAGRTLDGGPRVVRGVAGSGKTAVLATWVARTLAAAPRTPGELPLWVVYANKDLGPRIESSCKGAWRRLGGRTRFPQSRVAFKHVRSVLEETARAAGVGLPPYRAGSAAFDWPVLAAEILAAAPAPAAAMPGPVPGRGAGLRRTSLGLAVRAHGPRRPAAPRRPAGARVLRQRSKPARPRHAGVEAAGPRRDGAVDGDEGELPRHPAGGGVRVERPARAAPAEPSRGPPRRGPEGTGGSRPDPPRRPPRPAVVAGAVRGRGGSAAGGADVRFGRRPV